MESGSSSRKVPCSECVLWGENSDGSQQICDICYESNATNKNFPEDVDPVSIEDDVFPSDDDKGEEEKAIPW